MNFELHDNNGSLLLNLECVTKIVTKSSGMTLYTLTDQIEYEYDDVTELNQDINDMIKLNTTILVHDAADIGIVPITVSTPTNVANTTTPDSNAVAPDNVVTFDGKFYKDENAARLTKFKVKYEIKNVDTIKLRWARNKLTREYNYTSESDLNVNPTRYDNVSDEVYERVLGNVIEVTPENPLLMENAINMIFYRDTKDGSIHNKDF